MFSEYTQLPKAVYVLCLGSLINRAGSFVLIFLTIYVSDKLGFGETFAAVCMGAFGLGSIFASLIGGHLADKFGRKVVMTAALVGGAALLLLLNMGQSRPFVLMVIFGYGLLAEMFRPACMAMLGDVTLPNQRAIAFGLYYISINLGFACGPPLGGFLADISYNLLFWGDALTMVAFAIIVVLFLSESRPASQTDLAEAASPDEVPATAALRHIAADRPFILFCIATLFVNMLFMQCMVTLPMHIKAAGYSMTQLGWLMSVNGVMIVVCQLPLTHFLEQFKPMTNITLGGALIVAGFGAYCLPATVPLLLIAVLLWTTGEMMQAPFKQAVVTNLAPLQMRARYMGAFSMCFSISLTLGAPLGGYVLSEFGTRVLWASGASLAAIGVALYLLAYKSVSERTQTEQPEAACELPSIEPTTIPTESSNPYREPVA